MDISTAATGAHPLPMKGALRTIRSYILWQHERGTLHYDIMVTLILMFIFISPLVINFHDKPVSLPAHPTDVVVTTGADGTLLYQIPASSIVAGNDQSLREQLLRVIKPISGDVAIVSYEAVDEGRGHVQSYKVLAKR